MQIPIRQYLHFLITYLRPQWRAAAVLLLVLVAGIALELLNPQILRLFIDTVQGGGPMDALVRLALLFLGAALALQACLVAQTYLAANVGLKATNQLRADLALHCLQLDLSFHNARTPGELIERVDGDVALLGNFFSRFVVQVLGNALLLLGMLTLLFTIEWRVGALMSVFSVLTLALATRLRDVAVPYWGRARQASASLFGFLEERLSTTEDIRANGATDYVLRRLYERARELVRRELTAVFASYATGNTTILLFALGTAAGLGLGAYFYQQGTMSLGTVYLIYSYTQLVTRPIELIARQLQELQQAGASLSRVHALFQERSLITPGSQTLPEGPLAVEFDSVGFGYVAEERILSNLSFTLPAGEVLGLLGRTGSGKTTLIRLLFRFYDPTHGVVRLGGRDLREIELDHLRQRVGMVTQDIQLFHASVRDNLTFFDRDIPDARIVEVLDDLGLAEWRESLPAGLDTRLAPGGSGLSAGQAQLLAFARVFLKNPSLVVLDEASSRLDPATEQRLEHAIDRLVQGRTVIIIAHRLATVERADRLMILEDGCLLEYGPRAALAADPNSRFAQLLRVGLPEVL